MATLETPVSVGELLDKITILEIKAQRITERQKRDNVERELTVLNAVVSRCVSMDAAVLALVDQLREVNLALWDVEDALRVCEKQQQFDDNFVQLARSVYKHNDWRAELKKRINGLTGSALVEEKSYTV